MTSPTATILLPTTHTQSRSAVAPRAERATATASTAAAGRTSDLVPSTIGGYVSASRSHSANETIEGGYVTSTVYSDPADRIRGSYTSSAAGTARSSAQGSYVTL